MARRETAPGAGNDANTGIGSAVKLRAARDEELRNEAFVAYTKASEHLRRRLERRGVSEGNLALALAHLRSWFLGLEPEEDQPVRMVPRDEREAMAQFAIACQLGGLVSLPGQKMPWYCQTVQTVQPRLDKILNPKKESDDTGEQPPPVATPADMPARRHLVTV